MSTKIAFLGTGYITDIHLKSLRRIPDVKIAAFCNPHVEKARELAAGFQANAYADCAEMLRKEALDAVYVCVPPFAHQGQELLVAERGIPMFIEKPIALDVESAAEVDRMVAAKRLITSVGYVFRYFDLIGELQKLLAGRKIAMCLARYSATMPGVYWWGKRQLGGGQIMEQSTHVFDLLRMLIGEVESFDVCANFGIMKPRKEYDVEDASVVNLRFASGTIGNVASNCLYPNGGVVQLDIVGDAFRAELSLLDAKMKVLDENGCREFSGTGFDQAFLDENQAFIHAVRTGDLSGIKSSYRDAFQTQKLTVQITNSLHQGKD